MAGKHRTRQSLAYHTPSMHRYAAPGHVCLCMRRCLLLTAEAELLSWALRCGERLSCVVNLVILLTRHYMVCCCSPDAEFLLNHTNLNRFKTHLACVSFAVCRNAIFLFKRNQREVYFKSRLRQCQEVFLYSENFSTVTKITSACKFGRMQSRPVLPVTRRQCEFMTLVNKWLPSVAGPH